MLAGQPTTSYDEIPYSDNCFPYTHPDYLATFQALYGIKPSSLENCRVLELGAARGGNLIPMALELPHAWFVGIDLSARQIAAGQATVEQLGLRNIDLRAMSITDLDERAETFDYIVCHGVYSWVPEPVRRRILEICQGSLAPDGVAYISYNTFPGWHARGMVRQLMAFHLRDTHAAGERIEKAREFLDRVVRVIPNQAGSYARILRFEGEFLRQAANTYLYHEHLEETNHPMYYHEFIGEAHRHGLRFLAEARTPGLALGLPPEALEALNEWADDEDAREQYLDILTNRTFRRTILCHSSAPRASVPSHHAISWMSISTAVVPTSANPDIVSDAPEEFRRPDGGGTVTTNNPLIKTALTILSRAFPRALSFESLSTAIRETLGDSGGDMRDDHADAEMLSQSLLRSFLADLVELHVRPPRFAAKAVECPLASPLARLQSAEGERVTNLRRRTCFLDEFDRVVIKQLDGTRDRAEVLAAIRRSIDAGDFTIYDGERPIDDPAVIDAILAEQLEPRLQKLAGLALLVD
jgi:methyltransferase-like protein/SAM-dependent methyltransferase